MFCSESREWRWHRAAVVLAALAGFCTLGAAAHDIPIDVRINAFVKPAGNRLELLIRVPLAAMIEAEFPTHGAGFIDISRADEALRNATRLYLIGSFTQLAPVWRAYGVAVQASPDKRESTVGHSAFLYGITGRGAALVLYPPTFELAWIVHDAPLLAND